MCRIASKANCRLSTELLKCHQDSSLIYPDQPNKIPKGIQPRSYYHDKQKSKYHVQITRTIFKNLLFIITNLFPKQQHSKSSENFTLF